MGSTIGELTGANRKAARAASRAARAEQGVANEQMQFAKQNQAALLSEANDPQALARIEKQINSQERQVARQESLIESIDPALKEAAKQAMGLLQGKESSALGPLKRQREQQRNKLMNTLRERLGPGAETSSAGQQALNRFDSESDTILGQAQQSTLSGLLGGSRQTRAGINLGGEIGQLSQLSGQKFNRNLQARSAGAGLISNAFGARRQTAGAQFVGQSIRAKQQQAMGGEIGGAIIRGGMAFATGGLSEATQLGSTGAEDIDTGMIGGQQMMTGGASGRHNSSGFGNFA